MLFRSGGGAAGSSSNGNSSRAGKGYQGIVIISYSVSPSLFKFSNTVGTSNVYFSSRPALPPVLVNPGNQTFPSSRSQYSITVNQTAQEPLNSITWTVSPLTNVSITRFTDYQLTLSTIGTASISDLITVIATNKNSFSNVVQFTLTRPWTPAIPTISNANWYSQFTYQHTAGFAGSFTTPDPTNYPGGQYQFCNSTGSTSNQLYLTLPNGVNSGITFTLNCDIFINAGADSLYIYWGTTNVPGVETGGTGGWVLNFECYGGALSGIGIYLMNGGTGTNKNSTNPNTNSWIPITLTWNGTTQSVTLIHNGVTIYNNLSLSGTLAQTSGNYLGFGARDGGVTGTFYIRRVSLTGTG